MAIWLLKQNRELQFLGHGDLPESKPHYENSHLYPGTFIRRAVASNCKQVLDYLNFHFHPYSAYFYTRCTIAALDTQNVNMLHWLHLKEWLDWPTVRLGLTSLNIMSSYSWTREMLDWLPSFIVSETTTREKLELRCKQMIRFLGFASHLRDLPDSERECLIFRAWLEDGAHLPTSVLQDLDREYQQVKREIEARLVQPELIS